MLKALYDYAIDNGLTLPAGFINKTVKGYISLSGDGTYHGIDLVDDEIGLPTPDIGSLANGTEKSNLLVEKISVVIPDTPSNKSKFFIDGLSSVAELEPRIGACVAALSCEDTIGAIRNDIVAHKMDPSHRISFKVDGIPIVSMPGVPDWWSEFRRQFINDSKDKQRCLITGELITPVATTPKIKGLFQVGGHAGGDSLVCFDKAAFTSYGLKQAANAPVSEEAISAVKSALDALLKDAPVLAGMKFVHWYDGSVTPTQDIVTRTLCTTIDEYDDEFEDELDEEEKEQLKKEAILSAKKDADALVNSVKQGEQPFLPACSYHILLLTGVGGRVMVRRYQHGTYEDLYHNLKLWWQDIAMENLSGTGWLKHWELSYMLTHLLKRKKIEKKQKKSEDNPRKRMSEELAGVIPAVLVAILNGSPLPDTVAARALSYIRSRMVDADKKQKATPVPDSICCQWLKVWLIRKRRREHLEEIDMTCYHVDHPEQSYHCGALTALYGHIQSIAMPDVNTGVIQRYYASASQKPALVLGQMERLATHHLAKFKSKGMAKVMSDKLAEVYVAVGDSLPKSLNLEQQAYFALGYRQMQAQLNRERAEYKEKNKSDEE